MIELYAFPTPNGMKVRIMLEEADLTYREIRVDITKDQQFEKKFLAISPNNKIPALIDSEGPDGSPISLFESGAILLYLAEKTGLFLPTDAIKRHVVMQWLFFQMGGVGPMFGQFEHFTRFASEKIPYAINRYEQETIRLCSVMETRLKESSWLGGEDYSIADMATWPWVRASVEPEEKKPHLADYPALKAWYQKINTRPAVQKAVSPKITS